MKLKTIWKAANDWAEDNTRHLWVQIGGIIALSAATLITLSSSVAGIALGWMVTCVTIVAYGIASRMPIAGFDEKEILDVEEENKILHRMLDETRAELDDARHELSLHARRSE